MRLNCIFLAGNRLETDKLVQLCVIWIHTHRLREPSEVVTDLSACKPRQRHISSRPLMQPTPGLSPVSLQQPSPHF